MPFFFFFFCHSRGGWAGGGVPGGFTPAEARFLEGRGARCSPGRRRCQAGRIRSWYDHRSQITDQPPTKAGKTTLYHGRHGERQAGPEWLSAAGLGRLQLGTATSTLPFRDLSLHISQRFATPSMVHLRGAHADVV